MRPPLAACCALLLCFACRGGGEGASSSNGLLIEPPAWDFGAVDGDSLLRYTFRLHNPTEDTLIIHDVVTSCGCVDYRLSAGTLPPGGATELLAELDPRGLTGEFSRSLVLFTSAREEPYALSLTARVPLTPELVRRKYRMRLGDNLRTSASCVYMGNLHADDLHSRGLEVVSLAGKTLPLRMSVLPPRPYVEVVAPDELPPLTPRKITLLCDGSRMPPADWGVDTLRLCVSLGGVEAYVDCHVLLLPYPRAKSRMRPRLSVTSRRFDAGRGETVFSLRNAGNAPLRLIDLRLPPGVTVAWRDTLLPPGARGELVLKHAGPLPVGVTLLTNDAFTPVLSLAPL